VACSLASVEKSKVAEVCFLLVEAGRNIVAHEREIARDDKGLVAAAQKLEVDGLAVEKKAEEGQDTVYWYHCEDSNDASRSVVEWI
jgi:hypothetical protein